MNMTKTERFKKLRLMMCCCGCGRPPPSDVAHSNASMHGKGIGIKSKDEFTIPLNRICHQNFDQNLSQQTRQQQMDWFNKKLAFINEVLDDQSKDEASLF